MPRTQGMGIARCRPGFPDPDWSETKTTFLRSCPRCLNDLDEDDARICKSCEEELEARR